MRLICGFVVFILLTSSSDQPVDDFDYKAFKSFYNLTDSITTQRLTDKAVLVEFWASWCLPCRVKNGELNKLYEKYGSNGFEIISVALDTDSTTWQKAIKNDFVAWPTHALDTAKWNSTFIKSAKVYYLPNNVLLNKSGDVVAREVYGDQLESWIKSME